MTLDLNHPSEKKKSWQNHYVQENYLKNEEDNGRERNEKFPSS